MRATGGVVHYQSSNPCRVGIAFVHCICSAAVIMDYGGDDDDDDDDDGWNGMDKRAASRKMLITQVKPRNH